MKALRSTYTVDAVELLNIKMDILVIQNELIYPYPPSKDTIKLLQLKLTSIHNRLGIMTEEDRLNKQGDK